MTLHFSKPPHCRGRSVSLETREAISSTIKANPLWAMQHARQVGKILYVWNCVGCGIECGRYSRPDAGFCNASCKNKTNHACKGKKFSSAWDKADQIIELYCANDGHKTIAKRLGISPRIAREILIANGEWKPGTIRSSDQYKKKIGDAVAARVPAWKRERNRKNKASKAKKGRTWATADLPLFAVLAKKKRSIRSMESFRRRYKEDHTYRILHCLRKRWNKVVKRGRGYGGSVLAWLGCTADDFVQHLQKQYEHGMHDGNYGCGEGQWSIDHIRPCASIDLRDEAQRLACFHFSNARPMWHIDNMKKGATWKV